jgi:phosphate starvation-inducible PhoH-like protein
LSTKKKSNKAYLTPINQKQEEYQKAISDNDIIFGIGPAGVGKSYVAAMEAAMSLDEGSVARIILVRPAREAAGEKLGYLPGTAEEKVEPYFFPILDSWADVWTPGKVDTLIGEGRIQYWPVAHLRGRTFRNAFVIVDELQNLTLQQLYLVLTRFGEGSKMVLDGDWRQSDLLKHEINGKKLVEALEGKDGIAHITFSTEDVIRHPIVTKVIESYEELYGNG